MDSSWLNSEFRTVLQSLFIEFHFLEFSLWSVVINLPSPGYRLSLRPLAILFFHSATGILSFNCARLSPKWLHPTCLSLPHLHSRFSIQLLKLSFN